MSDGVRQLHETEDLRLRREYEERRALLEALTEGIRHACVSALLRDDIPFHSVKARVKSIPSVLEKIIRKDYAPSLDAVRDLVGVRVICLYPLHIDVIVNLLKREFKVLEVVDKRPQAKPTDFGYSSVHLVCAVEGTPRAGLPEYAKMEAKPFEIQIRTILQEAWAEIEHEMVYKSAVAAPDEVKRLINRLSGSLEIADEQFQEIFNRREAYVKKLKESNLQVFRDESLNIDSLTEVIDRRYPWAVGWRESAGEMLVSYLNGLLKDLFNLGIKSVQQLLLVMDKWQDTVYRESERAYLVGSGKLEKKAEGEFWGHVDNDDRWAHRTRQYLRPIGQIRYILAKEFPKYAETLGTGVWPGRKSEGSQ
jgi:putative GTP pyrophosphokinase